MRPIALGRKNYLFMGLAAGGKAATIAYTLIETAKRTRKSSATANSRPKDDSRRNSGTESGCGARGRVQTPMTCPGSALSAGRPASR